MYPVDGLRLLAESNGCSVYRLQNETGEGTMTVYRVFPGVMLIYNDFHMNYCDSGFHAPFDMLCIDHCREGRIEYLVEKEAYSYVQAGDLKIDNRVDHDGRFFLPLSHYHGITISFYLNEAAQALGKEIRDYQIDIKKVRQKFCRGSKPYVLHNAVYIEHIFNELYTVPEKIKLPYFKIKVLELMLYLDALEVPKESREEPYFYKSQVEKIKAMQKMMTDNLGKSYTLGMLSEQFDISLTALKTCFKHVYGYPVNTYMRIYRMNRAAVLLKQEKHCSESVIGKTPLEYRKTDFTALRPEKIVVQPGPECRSGAEM